MARIVKLALLFALVFFAWRFLQGRRLAGPSTGDERGPATKPPWA